MPEINDNKTPNWFIICLLYNKVEFVAIFILKLKIYSFLRDTLSIWQLHTLLSRIAQIYLELHFCVELHTKKALLSLCSFWVFFCVFEFTFVLCNNRFTYLSTNRAQRTVTLLIQS